MAATQFASLRLIALMMALCLGIALSGCSTTKSDSANAPSSSTVASSPTTSLIPSTVVDLSRLGAVKDDFPAGYPANPPGGVGKSNLGQAERIGDFVSYGKPFTVDPQSCRALLKPVESNAGADEASVTSAASVQDPFISVTATDPVSVPDAIPESGCERFAFDVQGAIPDGTVEQLAVPEIEDATTYALRVDFTVSNPAATKPALVEYFYVALLGNRTFVNIWARVPQEFDPEPALPDLLTKAVAAIRGK